MSEAKTLNPSEHFKTNVTPKIDKNTRTVITAWVNHNGESEVVMVGQDLDITWLEKLIGLRVNEIISGKRR